MNSGRPFLRVDERTYVELGQRAEIDTDVTLGYKYPGCTRPTIVGDDAVIRSGSIVYANTTIGRRFTCGHGVIIRAETMIGDCVAILHRTTLEGKIRIGNGVKIMAHVYLPSTTTIGNLVFIGPGTTFLNDKLPMRRAAPVQGARVEDHATIGGGVTVCPGVTIGRGAFIGAGALVNKNVPPETLAYGVPIRFHPLPHGIEGRNLPELLLTQADLWGNGHDQSWSEEIEQW